MAVTERSYVRRNLSVEWRSVNLKVETQVRILTHPEYVDHVI